jgi:hypothetical protein
VARAHTEKASRILSLVGVLTYDAEKEDTISCSVACSCCSCCKAAILGCAGPTIGACG